MSSNVTGEWPVWPLRPNRTLHPMVGSSYFILLMASITAKTHPEANSAANPLKRITRLQNPIGFVFFRQSVVESVCRIAPVLIPWNTVLPNSQHSQAARAVTTTILAICIIVVCSANVSPQAERTRPRVLDSLEGLVGQDSSSLFSCLSGLIERLHLTPRCHPHAQGWMGELPRLITCRC